jgi:hypothetical protein
MSWQDRVSLNSAGGVLAYVFFQWGSVVRTGLSCTPGNAGDFAAGVEWAWAHRGETAVMGRVARAECEAKYTASRNYEMLMQIYRKAMDAREIRIQCCDARG